MANEKIVPGVQVESPRQREQKIRQVAELNCELFQKEGVPIIAGNALGGTAMKMAGHEFVTSNLEFLVLDSGRIIQFGTDPVIPEVSSGSYGGKWKVALVKMGDKKLTFGQSFLIGGIYDKELSQPAKDTLTESLMTINVKACATFEDLFFVLSLVTEIKKSDGTAYPKGTLVQMIKDIQDGELGLLKYVTNRYGLHDKVEELASENRTGLRRTVLKNKQ